jgi:hypothetical protein
MGDDLALDGGSCKSARQGGNTYSRGECKRTMTAQDCRKHRCAKQHSCRPRRRFTLCGEIDDGAAAEGDRQPWHQPARGDFGDRPFLDALRSPAGKISEALRPNQGGPAPGRNPRPPCLGPSARPALPDHRARPRRPRSVLTRAWYTLPPVLTWPRACIHSALRRSSPRIASIRRFSAKLTRTLPG